MTIEIAGSVKINSSNTVKAIKTITQSIDSITEYSSNIVTIAASTVDLALPISLITTTKFILISTDADIDVKLNGATSAVTILAGGSLILNGAISAITITNQSTETSANVEYIVAS